MENVLETSDLKSLRKTLIAAIKTRGWIAVTGDAGVGKTTALNTVLQRIDAAAAVQPPCLNVERIDIGYVLSAAVYGLQAYGFGEGEKPRSSMAAREVQVSRLLGEASQSREVVIVLEEAQRLHWRTLQSLKRMREMSFAGQSPLFTLVLVGQPELRNRLAIRREVNYRVRRFAVRGLSPSEFTAYAASQGWPKLAVSDALERLEQLTWDEKRGRSYIEVQAKLDEAAQRATVRGHKRIESEDVDDVFTSLRARMVKSNLSLGQIAKRIGEAKSTLHAALETGNGAVYEKARAMVEETELKVG